MRQKFSNILGLQRPATPALPQFQPDHFDALQLLGVIAGQTNKAARAAELTRKALESDPNNTEITDMPTTKIGHALIATCKSCKRPVIIGELIFGPSNPVSLEGSGVLRVKCGCGETHDYATSEFTWATVEVAM